MRPANPEERPKNKVSGTPPSPPSPTSHTSRTSRSLVLVGREVEWARKGEGVRGPKTEGNDMSFGVKTVDRPVTPPPPRCLFLSGGHRFDPTVGPSVTTVPSSPLSRES